MPDLAAPRDVASPYERSPAEGPLMQGEILSHVMQVKLAEGALDQGGEVTVGVEDHPLAIIVTQACDLDWDYKAREGIEINGKPVSDAKLVPNVLLLIVYEAAKIRAEVNSRIWERIRDNKDERYQFLEVAPPEADAAGEGLPEMCIDFKHCFTVPTAELYDRLGNDTRRRARLTVPFREHLSARLGYYLLRVGLPREHLSEPGLSGA